MSEDRILVSDCCNLPELVDELLEREAAMLMALERREAGMVDCPARDCTVAAPR